MDTVTWTKEKFLAHIKDELDIDLVVFSALTSSPEELLNDLHSICGKKHQLTIDHENLMKLFNVNNSSVKLLMWTKNEVAIYKELMKDFDEARTNFSGNEDVDLIFEFQTWMQEQIIKSEERMIEENNFTFEGDGAANESGHIANMKNQLRLVMHEIREEASRFQNDNGREQARRCPHCREVWTREQWHDGATTCGDCSMTTVDTRDSSSGVFGTFAFEWTKGRPLNIKRSQARIVQKEAVFTMSSKFRGCGKSITWANMAPSTLQKDTLKDGDLDVDEAVNQLPGEVIEASYMKVTLPSDLPEQGPPATVSV